MKYLMWLLKAAIFFTLFAFALNNQQDATVHFFFGTRWSAPMVLIVLGAFAAGLVFSQGSVDQAWETIRGLPRPLLLSIRNTFRRKGRLSTRPKAGPAF